MQVRSGCDLVVRARRPLQQKAAHDAEQDRRRDAARAHRRPRTCRCRTRRPSRSSRRGSASPSSASRRRNETAAGSACSGRRRTGTAPPRPCCRGGHRTTARPSTARSCREVKMIDCRSHGAISRSSAGGEASSLSRAAASCIVRPSTGRASPPSTTISRRYLRSTSPSRWCRSACTTPSRASEMLSACCEQARLDRRG